VELPRQSPAACPSCPKCQACPECPKPQCPSDGGCKQQLSEVRTELEASKAAKADAATCRQDLEELSGRLPEAQAAWDTERKALRLECRKSVEQAASQAAAKATEEAAQACANSQPPVAEAMPSAAAEQGQQEARAEAVGWPGCVEQDVVLRGKGVYASFEDITTWFGSAAKGCWDNDCTRTDKFEAPSAEDCARACAVMSRCAFWTFGFQDGANHCFLRTSDAGREGSEGFTSASMACQPPATEVSPAQAALAVLDSEELRACDSGGGTEACPDLHNAMRTWNYGIQNLRVSLEGTPHNVGRYLEQISADAEAFIGMAPSDQLTEFYPISAANNRQVFEAVRSFLTNPTDDGQATQLPSALDVSVPRPARGLLCQGDCLA